MTLYELLAWGAVIVLAHMAVVLTIVYALKVAWVYIAPEVCEMLIAHVKDLRAPMQVTVTTSTTSGLTPTEAKERAPLTNLANLEEAGK